MEHRVRSRDQGPGRAPDCWAGHPDPTRVHLCLHPAECESVLVRPALVHYTRTLVASHSTVRHTALAPAVHLSVLQLQRAPAALLKSPALPATSHLCGKTLPPACRACVWSLCLASHSLYLFPGLFCHSLRFSPGSPNVVNAFCNSRTLRFSVGL